MFPSQRIQSMSYDLDGRMPVIADSKNGSSLQAFTYTYDPNGNRITVLDTTENNDNATTFTYDAKDRLIEDETSGTLAHHFTYTYDSRDNILTSSEEGEVVVQTYDAASRLIDRTTSTSSESYTYDANGNMNWLVADGKESAYTWNKENMLVNVVYKGTPETDAEFTYNAFNQRVMESESAKALVPG